MERGRHEQPRPGKIEIDPIHGASSQPPRRCGASNYLNWERCFKHILAVMATPRLWCDGGRLRWIRGAGRQDR